MKSMCSLGPAVFVLSFVILNGPSVAGPLDVEVLTSHSSIESKCRGRSPETRSEGHAIQEACFAISNLTNLNASFPHAQLRTA